MATLSKFMKRHGINPRKNRLEEEIIVSEDNDSIQDDGETIIRVEDYEEDSPKVSYHMGEPSIWETLPMTGPDSLFNTFKNSQEMFDWIDSNYTNTKMDERAFVDFSKRMAENPSDFDRFLSFTPDYLFEAIRKRKDHIVHVYHCLEAHRRLVNPCRIHEARLKELGLIDFQDSEQVETDKVEPVSEETCTDVPLATVVDKKMESVVKTNSIEDDKNLVDDAVSYLSALRAAYVSKDSPSRKAVEKAIEAIAFLKNRVTTLQDELHISNQNRKLDQSTIATLQLTNEELQQELFEERQLTAEEHSVQDDLSKNLSSTLGLEEVPLPSIDPDAIPELTFNNISPRLDDDLIRNLNSLSGFFKNLTELKDSLISTNSLAKYVSAVPTDFHTENMSDEWKFMILFKQLMARDGF